MISQFVNNAKLRIRLWRAHREKGSVYAERNYAVLFGARMAEEAGYKVRVWKDEKEPDWPVVYIDTPKGQVSWHVSPGLFEKLSRQFRAAKENCWDGHSTKEKHKRIRRLIRSKK